MSFDPRTRSVWKKELAALICGLLVGSAWEAVHAQRAGSPPALERR